MTAHFIVQNDDINVTSRRKTVYNLYSLILSGICYVDYENRNFSYSGHSCNE